ncbi:MAG: ribosome small subunit-dependent GTPase A [Rudaea sp.]|uniref:ribosome small subunit-dependent GTPase A n=1 Tax=unclassified Rudaea TaxID=2627037 RepID=UPI0010F4C81E|nr:MULTISPECIES: ribosome small subunit-dependent GTPase A [unclassified Rudaea]MBN8885239.1 ribosome small subunit-dependent GTPase A [Rudaea sp.]
MQIDDATQLRLGAIGWREDTATPDDAAADSRIARVIAQHRNGYVASDGEAEFAAQPAPRFLRRSADPALRPAVGDFVVVDAATPAVIHAVLPRRTTLARAAAGERYARQIIAANIDTAFVLMGLDGDFNPRRIERYLLLIAGSGVAPVIVLTKADRLENEAMHTEIEALRAQIPLGVELHAVNAKDAAAVAPLLHHLQRGDTAVLLGSSGAGKSTLTNTLLGHERQATGSVRDHDSRGRHTTTHRALIPLPSGGCLIDTPGMRELKLTGEEDLTASSFDDIEALALECRFGDCAHGNEPGCAVRAALESGALDPARWENFRKLRDELNAANESLQAQLERKAGAKVLTRALSKRLVDKYGRR